MPPQVSNAALEAVELAASAGLVLDAWQAQVLEWALGEKPDGRWSAFSVALIVARQNGKGSILEALELACLFLFGDDLILHSAHEFKTASDAFRRVIGLIESTPDLDRRIKQVYRGHGNESIELLSGQRLKFVARSGGSGRGFSGDKIILDEAFNLSDNAMAALLPTMATRPNPQIWYTSSAPLELPVSDVLRRLCKRGRSGDAPSLAYIEYCADTEADHEERSAWRDANPGYGIRISEEFIENERTTLEPADFARERLGVWVEDVDGSRVLPPEAWEACRSPKSGLTGAVSFALDVSPDRASATFAVAGTSGLGGIHNEVVDHRSGTAWVVARAKELQNQWHGVIAIAKNSPAWSLKDALDTAGVKMLEVDTAELAQACGQFYDDVVEHRIKHIDQPDLNRAIIGADKRFYGDAWLWSRKASSVDISPLVAVTLARWAHVAPPVAIGGLYDPNDDWED